MLTQNNPQIAGAPIPTNIGPSWTSILKSKIAAFYHKYEKYTELAIFGVGFIWDSLTMTRVDNPIDNIILSFYLAIIAVMIILTLRRQCGVAPPKWIEKIETRFLWAMQFCFGGLFSSYVIFYFKSASWTRTQFFFLVLVCLWIGNEFLKQRLKNRELLAVLYCFCLFSFLAFFLPVILARVETWIFILAGLLSLIISFVVFGIGLRANRSEWRRNMARIAVWICSIWLTVNALYFLNLIPPVPLALKTAKIYHHVARTSTGYEVQYVAPPLYRFWRKWDNPFYYSQGESAYCYTSIFAPGKVRVPVKHVWSYRTADGWKQTDQIAFRILGGREEGYRGFTAKSGIKPGQWRVEVETNRGQILGLIEFTITRSPTPHPPLQTEWIQ
jgi:hypothetical protein